MSKIWILLLGIIYLLPNFGYAITQPSIMVIPFTKEGEDLRTVLDNDVNRRIAITKVKEGFDNKGYTTVDFIGKLKAAKDNRVFTSDNQNDVKSKIIEFSGCDIYVVVEVDAQNDNSGTAVNIILASYETSTGNSLSNKVGTSGKFYTTDLGKLTTKAVEKCIDEFVDMMSKKFADNHVDGYSVLVDLSFAEGSVYTMKSDIPQFKMPLSDVLEDWFAKNSVNNSYHIQGTSELKMIFDNVKIPLKDGSGRNYNTNRYALDIYKFLSSIGLMCNKDIKANTIYITIN